MARTLQPESRIAHYRVVGPLGAGGMGEVYRAHDEKLGRDVALKVLPPELVRDEDRVRRFVLEARSASSLNHPHIVTIYDVGHDTVRAPDDPEAGTGDSVHYIAMELVTGKTLQDLLHVEKIDLRTVLGYLAQAAEGLAKAHAAGIVHRDLKPGNIMVTTDGYAKVLDFGLAKLTERADPTSDATDAPTATGDGMVVGTVGYMAPEQVRGKGVDHRADVFSFGCLLYEAATRRRPFVAESQIDTLHRILHDDPVPIDSIDQTVPTELRRVVKRCLAKNPEQRLQSMKDLAIELRDIVDEFDQLSASATSGSIVAPPQEAPGVGSGLSRAGIAAIALLGIVGLAVGGWALLRDRSGGSAGPKPFETVQMRGILSGADIAGATLSRDGRYLAYVTGPAGRWSMHVRQVATGSDVEVLPASSEFPGEFTFSPDGDYLYLLKRDPETPSYSALFEVPSLGGTPRKKLFDIDTAVSFSPDGTEIAFLRGLPQNNEAALMVAKLSGGEPRRVAVIASPELAPLDSPPAWSPDGRRILVSIRVSDGGLRQFLAAFDAASGERLESVLEDSYINIDSYAWLPDGTGLAVAGFTRGALSRQIEWVGFPGGERRQITTDLDGYSAVSVADEGRAIAALRRSGGGMLWTGGLEGPSSLRQLTFDTNEGVGDILVAEDGTILFVATADGFRQLFAIAPDGTGRRLISAGGGHVVVPILLPDDAGVIYTVYSKDDFVGHVYRSDLDGGNRVRLTDGSGEQAYGVTPDGAAVLFTRANVPDTTWSIPSTGGEVTKFLEHDGMGAQFSPDGRYLVYGKLKPVDDRSVNFIVVAQADDGTVVMERRPPPGAGNLQWTPDSAASSFVLTEDGVQNLWKLPVPDGEPVPITRFAEGRINDYRWSSDGAQIAMIRTVGTARNVWLMDADGGNARALTDFRSGVIFDSGFAADDVGIVFVYGDIRTDVVLIRDVGRAVAP